MYRRTPSLASISRRSPSRRLLTEQTRQLVDIHRADTTGLTRLTQITANLDELTDAEETPVNGVDLRIVNPTTLPDCHGDGLVYAAGNQDGSCEVGVWLEESARGRRLGREVLDLMLILICESKKYGYISPTVNVIAPSTHNDGSDVVAETPLGLDRHGWDVKAGIPLGLLVSGIGLQTADVLDRDKGPLLAGLSHRYRINLPDTASRE